MTTYNLQLAIGLDGVPQVVGGLKQVGAEVEKTGGRTTTATGRMRDGLNQTTSATGLLERSMMSFARVAAGLIAGISFVALTQQVFNFSSTLETANLGIASSFVSAGQYIDTATGQALAGQQALAAAQADAKAMTEELQVANFQTIATLDQLIRTYQETLPVAMARGFDRRQVKEFTVAMVQAAGAIGVSLDMLGEETRSILTGAINPRTSRIATVLGLTNEDVAAYKGNATGLYSFLMEKLSAYRAAGIESQQTWAGVWSNTLDLFNQLSAKVAEPLFETVKAELQDITGEIVKINTETGKIEWNPQFMEGVDGAKEAIAAIIAEVYRLAMLLDKTGGTLTKWGGGIASVITGGNVLNEDGSMSHAASDLELWFNEQNKKFQHNYEESDQKLQELANRLAGLNSDGSGKGLPAKTTYKPNAPPADPDATEKARKALEQYAAALQQLTDARRVGNPLLSEEAQAQARLSIQYEHLIAKYPAHRAELERNQELDRQQLVLSSSVAAQKKAEEEAEKALQKAQAEGLAVTESVLTAQERFSAEIAKLDALFMADYVGLDAYWRKIGELEKALEETADKKVIDALAEQVQLLQFSGRELAVQKNLRQLSADATAEQTRQVRDLTEKLYDENLAITAQQNSASALQEVFTSALTRIDGLFVNLWESGLTGFKDFADELKNTFRRLLAELIQMALRNQIILPIAAQMGIPGAASALTAAGGSAAGGAAAGGAAAAGAAGGATAGAGTGAFAAMAPYAVPAAAAIAAALYTHKVWTDESWGGTNTGTKALATAFPMLGITNKLMGGGLFGTSWKTKAAGLELGIEDGEFAGQDYETQKKKKSLGRGSKSRTIYSELDAQWEEFLSDQYEAVLTAIDAGARAFGDTASRQALASFSMAAEKIDLTGLNAEEQQAKIAAYFRTVSDAAITSLYPDIAAYTRLGEDATATFARLSGSLATVNQTAGLLHLTLLPAGLASGEMASQLIDLMGGMDAFTAKSGFFFANFYTAAEQGQRQTAAASSAVAEKFAELSLAIPATRADFADLVEGLDLTSESGRATFAALMEIAPAFDTVARSIEEAAAQIRESLREQLVTGLDVASNAAQALRDILGGSLGGASPERLYAERQQAFEAARRSGRDAELPELGRLLLEASQTYNASGTAFQADLAEVTRVLGGLAGIDGTPTLSAAERQVQLLSDIRTAIDEENAAQLALLADQTGLMRELLRQYLSSQGVNPSFAVGSPYIPHDMTANIHQGEKILDAQSSAILSRYGIRVQSAGDSRETVAELKESKAELKEQTRQLTATVRVLQAGLQRLIGLAEQQTTSSKELVGKARLAASA